MPNVRLGLCVGWDATDNELLCKIASGKRCGAFESVRQKSEGPLPRALLHCSPHTLLQVFCILHQILAIVIWVAVNFHKNFYCSQRCTYYTVDTPSHITPTHQHTQVTMASTKGKSLQTLINGLRYFGVGSKVTRNIYKFPDTYFVITRVNLSKDQNHGGVYGRKVWRGRAMERGMCVDSVVGA